MKPLRSAILLLFVVFAAHADVVPSFLFSDHAVLQQGKPIPVWGTAEPGEHIAVTFGDRAAGTVADKDGNWIVYLEALPASATPAELTITGKNTVHLTDVLVGEVWICSGQSNMEWTVHGVQNAPREIANAHYPQIRHLKVNKVVADKPMAQGAGAWTPCDPATVADFSAVAYFFARELAPRLNVPIGLINSTWGGTPIEAWMSPAALASQPEFSVVSKRWQTALAEYPQRLAEYNAAEAAWQSEAATAAAAHRKFTRPHPWTPQGQGSPFTPTGLFNGMINPLLPYAVRGFLWYQGESNASRARDYHALFQSMIVYWRKHFGQGDLPFYWVQLASYRDPYDPTGTHWAFLREAQAQALTLPETGQAVTIDIGTPDDIHPTNKQEVGRRLALLARAKTYNSAVDCSGPIFQEAVREGSALRIHFTQSGTGLTAHDKPLQAFEIAGADQKFHRATARLLKDTVVVSSPEVKEPVAVRYAWSNSPIANLYNGAGLPAAPFRSDSW